MYFRICFFSLFVSFLVGVGTFLVDSKFGVGARFKRSWRSRIELNASQIDKLAVILSDELKARKALENDFSEDKKIHGDTPKKFMGTRQ